MKTRRNKMSKTANNRRMTARLVLAGVAVVGIGAAVTTAVWTDNVFFTATATSSSFDLQGRAAGTIPWFDDGIPGDSDTVPIVLTSAQLSALSPGMTINVPFDLCNDGTTAGSITAVTPAAITGGLAGAVGLTATVTAPTVGTVLPPDATCATPIVGNLQVVTTAAFVLQATTGTITFDVTGTSD
jgi:hypothetical protein